MAIVGSAPNSLLLLAGFPLSMWCRRFSNKFWVPFSPNRRLWARESNRKRFEIRLFRVLRVERHCSQKFHEDSQKMKRSTRQSLGVWVTRLKAVAKSTSICVNLGTLVGKILKVRSWVYLVWRERNFTTYVWNWKAFISLEAQPRNPQFSVKGQSYWSTVSLSSTQSCWVFLLCFSWSKSHRFTAVAVQ